MMSLELSNHTNMVTEEALTIQTADGFKLSAIYYKTEAPKAMLILAGATGVPQLFYSRFARYAAKHGYNTITFDYRGIGRSKPLNLKGFKASFIDWATLDLAKIVDTFATPQIKTFMVGHSFGGHAFGLLPNHYKISGFYTFATGAGWHGWMPWQEAMRVKAMWKIILPTLTKWKGYTPMSILGMGEDLPIGVYSQWKHWCQFPHYFFDDPEISTIMKAKFADIRTPIFAANALDDLWAMPQARDAFMHNYKNTNITYLDIKLTPSLPNIGHMGYFRENAEPLWKHTIQWFNDID